MKPEELRIGNIIEKKFKGETPSKDSYWAWSFFRKEEFDELEKYPELFRPIPLNEEWSIRAGLDKEGSIIDLMGSYYELWIERGIDGVWMRSETTEKRIEYVHQLQNTMY